MSFTISENNFHGFETVILKNEKSGESVEIARMGATLLSFNIPEKDGLFNIIDGFADGEEMTAARGARSWIMIPFANRIPEGKYDFNGKEYALLPVAPRKNVIHGFASFIIYDVLSFRSDQDSAEVIFATREIRPGAFIGYPFTIDLRIIFILTENKLTITVEASNYGEEPAPFATGWHPYFRTNEEGIENLVLTLNAEEVIKLDDNSIPLPGNEAYADLKEFPALNFNDYVPADKRVIAGRVLDHCYSGIKKDPDGTSSCSLYDPQNGMEITMFQVGGVTLAFSGDTLAQRARKSVALEPMQAITNAFNREEFVKDITILPGEKSVYTFGLKVKKGRLM
jgi:aldose 1-epimerase